MTGRGAWNVAGVGGTRDYYPLGYLGPVRPGPYYYNGAGYPASPGLQRTANEYAVHKAVAAYQGRLAWEGVPCLIDGLYGPATTKAMVAFQKAWKATGDPAASVWGGIGPETSERLLKPLMVSAHANTPHDPKITQTIMSGVIRSESQWDAGAVGFADETDVGLAQINAGAHPQWSTDQRLEPLLSFQFILEYLTSSLNALNGNLRDAIASYNLGVGGKNSAGVLVGAKGWIAAGRPPVWTPPGNNSGREVKKYIDRILAG